MKVWNVWFRRAADKEQVHPFLSVRAATIRPALQKAEKAAKRKFPFKVEPRLVELSADLED